MPVKAKTATKKNDNCVVRKIEKKLEKDLEEVLEDKKRNPLSMLIEYPRKSKKKRVPVGVFVSKRTKQGIIYGVSKCNNKDIFEKELGKLIAVGRMELGHITKLSDVPVTLIPQFAQFMSRSQKYFRTTSLINIG